MAKVTTVSSRISEWMVAVVLVVLLGVADFVGALMPLSRFGQLVSRPLVTQAALVMNKVVSPFYYITSLRTANIRVRQLEAQLAEASAQASQLDQLQRENQALRELLRATDVSLETRVITSPVLAYSHPLIAAGSEEGVQRGDMILVNQTLVGRATEVVEHQARVKLLSQDATTPVLAHTESGITGLVVGDGRRVLLTEVPVDQAVAIGERVLTVGQDGVAPGVLIGRVAQVLDRPSASSQTLVVEQLTTFYEAVMVEVR